MSQAEGMISLLTYLMEKIERKEKKRETTRNLRLKG